MSKSIKPEDLGGALAEQLTLYHESVIENVNAAGEKAIKALVKKTKATAPKGKRGDFRKAITYQKQRGVFGDVRCIWGAKAPKHRLPHLLVHGHLKEDGSRVAGDPFLVNAIDQVRPEYEKKVEEAIESAE